MTNYSIVEYFAEHEGYKCGYCKKPDTNYSNGMWANQLTVTDYQDLVDRGWRRSGKYCYKPSMDITCCPMYTIKCSVADFKLSKSQKKVLKRMNKFLIHGKNEEMKEFNHSNESVKSNDEVPNDILDASVIEKASRRKANSTYINPNISIHSTDPVEDSRNVIAAASDEPVETVSHSKVRLDRTETKISKPNIGMDPCKPQCRKAKDIRRERLLQKLANKSQSESAMEQVLKPTKNEPKVKSLEEFLLEAEVTNPAHKLEVKTVRCEPISVDLGKTFAETLHVYQKYQTIIHNDSMDKCTERQFTRFLVSSPLQEEQASKLDHGYGSFHQQYWLDGKLIAVGVIDILPKCVSSVYLFYDPDYSFLSLGTYAALREIGFTRELCKKVPELKSYYMGFYIHSCPKMRYKAQYFPSFLLCPETYTWHPYERCKEKLDKSKYARLEEDSKREDENGKVVMNEILVLHRRKIKSYPEYFTLAGTDDREVKQYASLVGRKCYSRMLLYKS